MKRFLIFLMSLALFTACESPTSSNSGDSLFIGAELLPIDVNEWEAEIFMVTGVTFWEDGSYSGYSVENAIVTVDGQTCDEFIDYSTTLTSFTDTQSIPLSIQAGDYDIQESIAMPEAVTLTSSNSISNFDVTGDLTISWDTYTGSADYIEVFIESLDTVSGEDYSVVLESTATNHTIPGGTIDEPFMLGTEIQIRTCNETAISGDKIDSRSYYKASNASSVMVN